VGALSFRINDLSAPKPAEVAAGEVDLTTFSSLTTQVDAPALSKMLNSTLPVSLPDALEMLDAPYLGHVIVLWSWALKQPSTTDAVPVTVRFHSLDGHDREMEVPHLMFTEPVSEVAS
jgi:hypothetical protein